MCAAEEREREGERERDLLRKEESVSQSIEVR